MVASGLDWREMGRPRSSIRDASSRSGRTASRAEVYAAQSLAYRAVDASGELRFSGRMACADDRNRRRTEHSGARAISFARGLRALLHAGGIERRVRATDAAGG